MHIDHVNVRGIVLLLFENIHTTKQKNIDSMLKVHFHSHSQVLIANIYCKQRRPHGNILVIIDMSFATYVHMQKPIDLYV